MLMRYLWSCMTKEFPTLLIVVSLKGDEEAEMGIVSDIHENLRKSRSFEA